MSGLGLEDGAVLPVQANLEYNVLKQRVDLDVDFARRSLFGTTEITVQPLVKDLRQIWLHCRQCKPTGIQAGGITAKFEYDDPYRRPRTQAATTVYQHEMFKSRISGSLRPAPVAELRIALPAKLKIQELHVDPVTALPVYNGAPSIQKQEGDALAILDTPIAAPAQQQGPQFAPIKLFIEFEVRNFSDGLHWVGFEDGDKRFPYCYTKAEPYAGNTSCIFPCVDDATSRCSWEIAISCARTLGDAFRKSTTSTWAPDGGSQPAAGVDIEMTDGTNIAKNTAAINGQSEDKYLIDLSQTDAELDLTILCIGEQSDDMLDSEDNSRHTMTFTLNEPVTARHLGFAIGPFEHVDLSASREIEDEERLGQSAVKVDAFCLPGRSEEVRITCHPITRAIDYFGVNYGSFPFSSYQMLFVDDFVHDTVATAGLSFCSARLLLTYDIIEPLEENTRKLIRTVADQWMGVNVVAKEPADAWAVAGIAGFMTDLYGKVIFGNNAYRWQQKLASEKVYELDVDRPSIHQQGSLLHIDPSIGEFLNLKSALVLFILDRRLMKTNASSGVTRIINRIFLNAKTGSLVNGELSTADFQRICEKLGHNKLESFFRQWVFGAGCPIFHVSQRFNKKKLVVEMTIVQMQLKRVTKPPFEPSNFMREVKEHVQEVWAPEIQPVFTGPMTIRIHEADGTPYEHIVEIKEATTKLEIPYNTKYKRLKRSRRQKERAMAEGIQGEGGEDALLYCLGDILDTPEEVKEWNLVDWSAEDETKMGQESYEWIRIDADFEWIGKIHLVMPLYMYVSQLQQDRDLVAQYESMRYLLGSNPHHASLTILVRTLMDRRYFHGIRSMAAEGLAIMAQEDGKTREIGQFHLEKAFEDMFCFPGEIMPRPNDWSDRTHYIIQCAIPKAMSRLRDASGKVPMAIRKFFVDKLKFNDNSNNEYSDCHYVATLMRCLADSLVVSHKEPEPSYSFSFGDDEPTVDDEDPDTEFEREAINEIERYRRIDEWITTFQNIYSIAALQCLSRLTKAGLVKDKTREVLQYTRANNADLVRLQAFQCLTETGLTSRMPMMKYLLQSIANDNSPFFRERLTRHFGEALGHIALGDAQPQAAPTAPAPVDADSGLILEQEASNQEKQIEAMRKTTPDGALAALKAAIGDEETFKTALWRATTSPITLDEAAAFCDVAALMYQPVTSCNVTVKLPRFYRCERTSKATVHFIPHGIYRNKPSKPLGLEDWQTLQTYGLMYSGPVTAEVEKAQRPPEERGMTIKLQINKLQQQPFQQTDTPSSSMPPPAVIPTLTAERSGIKLSLGSNKRKHSVDTIPREGSPKLQKQSVSQTSDGRSMSIPTKRSLSISSQRRDSTPGYKGSRGKSNSLLVKLPVSLKGSSKILDILSKPSKSPGGAKKIALALATSGSNNEQQQHITPISTHSSASPFFPGGLNQVSNANNFFTASPQSQTTPVMNLGSFRSYGPAPDAENGAATEVKQESVDTKAGVGSPADDIPGSRTLPPQSVSASPPAAEEGMAPPPRPKLKLKFSSSSKSNSP